jgi:predicted permease
MLLSASALLLGTFLKMRSIPSGVTTKRLEVLQVNLKGDSFATTEKSMQFIDKVEERLRRIPSVSQVATVNGLPLDRGLNTMAWPDIRKESRRNVDQRFVTPGYFHTAGTSLLAGRDISIDDRAESEKVTLVNQRMAELWWPGHSPLGEYVSQGGKEKWRVIGVVADVHDRSLTSNMRPTWYVPYRQVDDKAMQTINGWFPTSFVIRVSGDAPIAIEVEKALHDANPEVPIAKFRGMQSFVDDSVAAPRFFSWIASSFALFSLIFTAVGLFGLLSYQVAARTKEIGIRMAIGATREQILMFVMRRGVVLTLSGMAIGVVGSAAVRHVIESILADTMHGTAPGISHTMLSSSAALIFATAGMLFTAVFASGLPARRAASIEPIEALRTE